MIRARLTPRLAGGVLLVLALLVYLFGAVPLREGALAAGDEYGRVRRQRQDLQARLLPLERREAALRRASASFSALSSGGSDVQGVRRAVVASLRDTRLSSVRLGVRPGRPPVVAALHLSASGRFGDVVALSGQLVQPGSGLILDRVRFTPRAPAVALELEASGLELRR